MSAGGPGDAPTIGAAMDSAQSGDEVLLGPGFYTWLTENASGPSMITLKPGVSIRSEAGPDATILDAQKNGRVLYANNVGEVQVSGISFWNGRLGSTLPRFGAGAYFEGQSAPLLVDCIFHGMWSLRIVVEVRRCIAIGQPLIVFNSSPIA